MFVGRLELRIEPDGLAWRSDCRLYIVVQDIYDQYDVYFRVLGRLGRLRTVWLTEASSLEAAGRLILRHRDRLAWRQKMPDGTPRSRPSGPEARMGGGYGEA